MASSTRSKPAAKKTTKVASKATAKKVSKVAAKPAAAKTSKESASKETASKAAAKKVASAKAAPAAKTAAKAASKADSKPVSKAASKVSAKTESKVKAKTASRKAAEDADEDDDDDDNFDVGTSEPTPTAASRPTPNAPVLPDDLAEVAAANAQPEPEVSNLPRKKSVLEVAEEDDEEYGSEPPMPTADNVDGLLDRLRKVAQFGGDALEELPRLIEQLEQIDDPSVMPRLLGLLEDNDPYGIYWNVLYVLEKFDDAYLRALLGGVEALYARAPQWAYTCVIRILNTRGDEDDCTAAFEKLVQASPASTRTLVLQILRELSADPDTDNDQKSNIARTITAVGGADAPAAPAKAAE